MPITSLFDVARVKFIRQRLKRPIKRLNPEWLDIDGYFCLPAPKYFAVGALLDHKPSASEICLFAVPLFSKEVSFNLSYADTIKGEEGRVVLSGKKASSIAKEFSAKAIPYLDKVRMKDDLNWFLGYLEESNILGNTRLKYDYGLALILLHRFEEAKVALKEVAECEWEKRVVPEEAENAGKLGALLESAPRKAFEEVTGYLESNIRKYGFAVNSGAKNIIG